MNIHQKKRFREKYRTHKDFALVFMVLACVLVYLFVSAPQALPDSEEKRGTLIPIKDALTIIANENASARALYTKKIVGPGLKVGIAFDEKWRLPAVHAGPLPALFLRETARNLEKQGAQLGLFLGSDFPIEKTNRFVGGQAEAFSRLQTSGNSVEYFLDWDTNLHTAMFPDYAIAKPCVDCHNDHPQSTKSDWVLNDMMGATTWSFAASEVTIEQLLFLLGQLRIALRQTYRSFLNETTTWPNAPAIGELWPTQGYFLPDERTFMNELSRQTSQGSLQELLKKVENNEEESPQ